MIVAFAVLIVLAGVAGCCWYFGAVCQGLDIERAALATERQRLEQWGRNLTRSETATPLYDQGKEPATVIEQMSITHRCHAAYEDEQETEAQRWNAYMDNHASLTRIDEAAE